MLNMIALVTIIREHRACILSLTPIVTYKNAVVSLAVASVSPYGFDRRGDNDRGVGADARAGSAGFHIVG